MQSVHLTTDKSWTSSTALDSPKRSAVDAWVAGAFSGLGVSRVPVAGTEVFFAHASNDSIVFAEELGLAGKTQATVCYGIIKTPGLAFVTDGVEFSIQEITGDGWNWGQINLKKHFLPTGDIADDHAEECQEFALSGKQTRLAFSTKPGKTFDNDASYWKSVAAH